MNWVICNLPFFSADINTDGLPKYPLAECDEEARKAFGETLDERREKVSGLGNLFYSAKDEWLDYDYETRSALSNDEINAEVCKLNKDFAPLLAYWEWKKTYEAWEEKLPIIIKYYEEYKAYQSRPKDNEKSFCGRGLNKPGTLIEVKHIANDSVEQLLLGDVNCRGGVCDDCKGIENDDVVLRYCVLWAKDAT